MTTIDDAELEAQLNDFDPTVRSAALHQAMERSSYPVPHGDIANMHCHTFFSFNAYGYSPTGLAWLGRRRNFPLMGIVDFDVLDAVDEFLDACEVVGVRGSAGIESRVFVSEFADREMNSPGEPGVLYHMGIGFTASQPPESAQPILEHLRRTAGQRNRGLIERVNAYLAPIAVDYEVDVLPLTPSGNATERHIVVAYIAAAQRGAEDATAFWAERLGLPGEEMAALMQNDPLFQNTIRSKLMKRGGVGYVQPGPATYPTVEDFHELITACEALPCAAWLDGTSSGEWPENGLLELLVKKGAVALNIVPNRNWDLKDPEDKEIKVQNLYQVVELARDLALPLNVGTEMNSYGQKLIDDFDAPELAPVREAFVDGAFFIYGHTVLQRTRGLGYQSEWAREKLPTRRERNAFYTEVGRRVEPTPAGHVRLRTITPVLSPAAVLDLL